MLTGCACRGIYRIVSAEVALSPPPFLAECVARRAKWRQTTLPPVWDVEEAVRLGKENQTCPYYTARDSLATADLILW